MTKKITQLIEESMPFIKGIYKPNMLEDYNEAFYVKDKSY